MYLVLSFQVQEVIFEIVVSFDPVTVSKVVLTILCVQMEYENAVIVMFLSITVGIVNFDMVVTIVCSVVVAIICSVVLIIVCSVVAATIHSVVIATVRSVDIASWLRVFVVSVAAKDGFIFTVEVSTILIPIELFTQDQDVQDDKVFIFSAETIFNVRIILI